MSPLSRRAFGPVLAAALAVAMALPAGAQAPGAPTVRVRGTVLAVSTGAMTVRDRGGEVVQLVVPAKVVINEVYPIALADIRPGSYIGTAAMPQPDGSQRAIAVSVFPESARGVGDGHRPFDLLPQSTMTNGNVTEVTGVADGSAGRRLQLKYKDGEKVIVVPADVPVVSSRPGGPELLVPGASVSLVAQMLDGKPTALRINAGRDGFVLPY